MADKVISLWGGLRHLRQKAVQVIFALVDIVMEHKCPIKAEVIYDKKTKQPLMVAGANPPRHRFMETPGGSSNRGRCCCGKRYYESTYDRQYFTLGGN